MSIFEGKPDPQVRRLVSEYRNSRVRRWWFWHWNASGRLYRLHRIVYAWTGWFPLHGDDAMPYCVECGERNLVAQANGTYAFAPDEWHGTRPSGKPCSVPRRRAVERRYVRRHGERAARRHSGF